MTFVNLPTPSPLRESAGAEGVTSITKHLREDMTTDTVFTIDVCCKTSYNKVLWGGCKIPTIQSLMLNLDDI